MFLDAAVVKKPPLAMAASLKAPVSLDIIPDEGWPVQRRQGSLTPGSSSPKVDWRATSPRFGGTKPGVKTLRRVQSWGSALSDFLGSTSSRKSLEENSAMRRSGSRGCLGSLEASGDAKAVLDGIGDDDRWDRLEEDRDWNFATLDNTLRPGGMLHRDTFPSPPFLSQEWQSLGNGKPGKESFPRPVSARMQLRRSTSMAQKKSIVLEQAQESFDSLKDRLESSLKMQPECSYAPPSAPSAPTAPFAPPAPLPPAMADVVIPPLAPLSSCRDVGVLGLAKDVGGLKLSTLPHSLKCRKNKEQNVRSCAVSNAFSALVFIMKTMHGHALKMQEDQVMKLVMPMQRDMELSFAWLFQQVFATTPEYMLSIMVLLAEFTVHSLGEDLALASALAMANSKKNSNSRRLFRPAKEDVSAGLVKELNRRHKAALSAKHEGIAETHCEPLADELANAVFPTGRKIFPEEEKILHALMAEAMEEMKKNSGWEPPPEVDKEALNKLVAPVQVTLSSDNYPCYDRTDLEYQHTISSQPTNVMLLSNYAQFLYVIRHDNNRYFTIANLSCFAFLVFG